MYFLIQTDKYTFMGIYTNEKPLFVILRAIHASIFKPWVLSF